ncbi:MAG: RsmE family RNA methyltransferase [Candidatus Acidiferrales bacterium]
MRRRFFTDKFENGTAFLRGEAAHHLARVLRAEPGQVYELSDGTRVRLARIVRVARDEVEFELEDPPPDSASAEIAPGELSPGESSRLECTLLLSVVKFDRFEWALEKATELGVSTIVPLSAARSEKALVAAAAKRAARWQKILLESAQQARRLRPPALKAISSPLGAFHQAGLQRDAHENVQQAVAPGILSPARILLSERRDALPLRVVLSKLVSAFSLEAPCEAVLAIGPEGGWTGEEFAMAAVAGFAEASLGHTILRTETAVTAALASINYALGD